MSIGITGISLLGVAFALLGALGLAISAISIRIGTQDGNASDALVVVLLTNVVVFVPLGLITYGEASLLTPLSVGSFVATGLVGTLLARRLHYAGIERLGASRAEPIKASQPLFASLIAIVVLGETLSGLHAAGIVLIVVGIALITIEFSSRKGTFRDASSMALLFPMSAAFLWGVEPIFAKVGLNVGTHVFVGLAIKTLSATVGFFAYRWYDRSLRFETTDLSSVVWYFVAGVANTAFLFGYYLALEVSTVSVVVPIVQTSPVLVVGFSIVFLQQIERVSWRLVMATLVVIAGSIVVTLFS